MLSGENMAEKENPYFTVEIFSSNPDIKALCDLYWELSTSSIDSDWPEFAHSLSAISKLSGIPTKKVERTASDYSAIQIHLWKCKGCEKTYVATSRKLIEDLSTGKKVSIANSATYLCGDCEKKEAEKKRLEKETQDQEKRILIRDFFGQMGPKTALASNLTLRQMVYFVSVMQAGGSENLQKIVPLDLWEQKLSPSKEHALKIISTIFDDRLIWAHPETTIDSVTAIDPNAGTFSYYPEKVTWQPSTSSQSPNIPGSLMQEILDILAVPWTNETWVNEAYELWFEIALEECKEFLVFQLNEHHFEFNPGEKTTEYLTYALKNFAVSKVFNLIWGSVQSAAALYQKGGISRKQAANTAVSAIQSKTERYIANQWDPKPFERNYSLPESIVARLFYSVVLGLGDIAIKEKISLEIIEKCLSNSSKSEDIS